MLQAYAWFLGVHQTCVVGGVLGYLVLVISFVAIPPAYAGYVGPLGFMITWYGLYFGVLNRDCAEVAANRMVRCMDRELYSRACIGRIKHLFSSACIEICEGVWGQRAYLPLNLQLCL